MDKYDLSFIVIGTPLTSANLLLPFFIFMILSSGVTLEKEYQKNIWIRSAF